MRFMIYAVKIQHAMIHEPSVVFGDREEWVDYNGRLEGYFRPIKSFVELNGPLRWLFWQCKHNDPLILQGGVNMGVVYR